MIILLKRSLEKLLFGIFHVTSLSLSNITLTVILSTSKMVGYTTYLLFIACLTAQQVNQTFIVTINTMVYFRSFLVVKLVNSSVLFMLLQT